MSEETTNFDNVKINKSNIYRTKRLFRIIFILYINIHWC